MAQSRTSDLGGFFELTLVLEGFLSDSECSLIGILSYFKLDVNTTLQLGWPHFLE